MSIMILIALALLIVFAIAEVRAHRRHESIQTVIHAEVASLKIDMQRVESAIRDTVKSQ